MSQRDIHAAAGRCLGSTTGEPYHRRLSSHHLDLAQSEAPAEPERLDYRLLSGKTGGKVTSWTRPSHRVLPLFVAEDALGEAWMTLQGTLEAVDLEQIDADSRAHFGGYLPRPATSFAVASSPLVPDPRPM
ncbi:MAG: hypothetical protein QOF13_1801 [Solirubrobacterales bacterium]|jgi:hypothetical protein|nr:hypothetical protein [Solirubrobacterales bacterium]